MDPHEITREILWNIPVWAKVLMYTSAAVATGFLVNGFYQRFKLWKQGQAAPAEDTKNLLPVTRYPPSTRFAWVPKRLPPTLSWSSLPDSTGSLWGWP